MAVRRERTAAAAAAAAAAECTSMQAGTTSWRVSERANRRQRERLGDKGGIRHALPPHGAAEGLVLDAVADRVVAGLPAERMHKSVEVTYEPSTLRLCTRSGMHARLLIQVAVPRLSIHSVWSCSQLQSVSSRHYYPAFATLFTLKHARRYGSTNLPVETDAGGRMVTVVGAS